MMGRDTTTRSADVRLYAHQKGPKTDAALRALVEALREEHPEVWHAQVTLDDLAPPGRCFPVVDYIGSERG